MAPRTDAKKGAPPQVVVTYAILAEMVAAPDLALARFATAVELPAALEIFAAHAASELGRRRARAARPLPTPEAMRARLEEADEARLLLSRDARVPLDGIDDAAGPVRDASEHGRTL